MQKIVSLPICVALVACSPNGSYLGELPEQVIELAAPNQNLNAVKILEEDGCYWYQHDGPVETTLLPLVSKRGQHICTPKQT